MAWTSILLTSNFDFLRNQVHIASSSSGIHTLRLFVIACTS